MKITKTAILNVILYATFLSCLGQDGSLDNTFDSDGIVTTSINALKDFGRGLAIQSDGKIIVAGYSYTGTRDVFAIVRYNTDGSLDTTFDGDGKVTTPIGTSGNRAHAVVIQNDGKIVTAGYSWNGTSNDFAVIRYNSNGSLDTTFDSDGIITVGFGSTTNDRAFSVALQSDNKIIVAGYNTSLLGSNRDFALVRLDTNGSLDVSFGTNGIVSTPIELGNDEARSIVIQSDGKIVVVGFSFNNVVRKYALVRYNTNGSLDTTFDSDGIVTTSISNNDDAAYSVALQTDGKMLVTGYTHGVTYDFGTVRYNTNGSLDTTFDNDGIVTTSIGTVEDLAAGITIQNDGKIIVAGKSSPTSGADNNFALVRYTFNGSLDTSFSFDGIVTIKIGTLGYNDNVEAIALQPDGKIIVAGFSDNGNNSYFSLVRYNNSNNLVLDSFENFLPEMQIYPNPTSDYIFLDSKQKNASSAIFVYNNFGQLVKQVKFSKDDALKVNVMDLPNGIYFVKYLMNDKVMTNKMIIQHSN